LSDPLSAKVEFAGQRKRGGAETVVDSARVDQARISSRGSANSASAALKAALPGRVLQQMLFPVKLRGHDKVQIVVLGLLA